MVVLQVSSGPQINLDLSFALKAVLRSFLILDSNGGACSEAVEVCRMLRSRERVECLQERSIAIPRLVLRLDYNVDSA
jgi:hypothetical protein